MLNEKLYVKVKVCWSLVFYVIIYIQLTCKFDWKPIYRQGRKK